MNFAVINFQTADEQRDSICKVELTFVENDEIIDTKSYLIKPDCYPDFDLENVMIHNISARDVKDSPKFSDIWPEIVSQLEGKFVFTHNGGFHMSALWHVLDFYEIEYPNFEHGCTAIAAKKLHPSLGLYTFQYLAEHFNINNNEPYTVQVARLALELLKDNEDKNIKDYLLEIGVIVGNISAPYVFSPCLSKRIYRPREQKYGLDSFPQDDSKHNPDSIFYNAEVVFTGSLKTMIRKEAIQKIALIGGLPSDSLKMTTNYLVCGADDIENITPSNMSGKFKKARSYAEKGCDIEIIDENTFLQNL